MNVNIKDSTIASTASIDDNSVVLKSQIGEHCMIGKNSRFCYSTMGDFSYISMNTHCFSCQIGKYSSISWNVSIGPANHDPNRISSHSMLFAKRFKMIGEEGYYNQYDRNVVIGNDVWVGCNAVVMRGVTVGDGAVIGANSIITKDVPPYSIVFGVNKFHRWRFDEEIRKRLLEIQWWNYQTETIRKCIDLIAKEPTLDILADLEAHLRISY